MYDHHQFTEKFCMMSVRVVRRNNLLPACVAGDFEFLEQYVRKYPDKRAFASFDNHKWGPLHHAVASNSYDCVQLLLSSKLVDPRWTSYEGETCLFVAVKCGSSQEIIKAILMNDIKLFDMPNNESVFPIHKAISKHSIETVRTMFTVMNILKVSPIPDQFDWENENSLFYAAREKNVEIVNCLIDNMNFNFRHKNDRSLYAVTVAMVPHELAIPDEGTKCLEVVRRLLPLTYDTSKPDCMQEMMLSIAFACMFSYRNIFEHIMETYYLTELNDHRDFVRRAIDSFQSFDAFEQCMKYFTGLHSKIARFLVGSDNRLTRDYLYAHIITDFHQMFKYNREVFIEIVKILRPKLQAHYLTYDLLTFLQTEPIDEMILAELIELFHVIRIEDLLCKEIIQSQPITSTENLRNFLLVCMPFLMAPTGDSYLDASMINYDEIVAKFCVKNRYRSKCDLKSLCRAVIRSQILQCASDEISNSELLGRIKKLPIPIPCKNFLLFNYSHYNFT